MTYQPVGAVLQREAMRFFECDDFRAHNPAAVKARDAVCLVLHNWGWTRPRISHRYQIPFGTVRTAIDRAQRKIADGSDMELRAAVSYLAGFLPPT